MPWNFTKFIVAADLSTIDYYNPRAEPAEILAKIEQLLSSQQPIQWTLTCDKHINKPQDSNISDGSLSKLPTAERERALIYRRFYGFIIVFIQTKQIHWLLFICFITWLNATFWLLISMLMCLADSSLLSLTTDYSISENWSGLKFPRRPSKFLTVYPSADDLKSTKWKKTLHFFWDLLVLSSLSSFLCQLLYLVLEVGHVLRDRWGNLFKQLKVYLKLCMVTIVNSEFCRRCVVITRDRMFQASSIMLILLVAKNM